MDEKLLEQLRTTILENVPDINTCDELQVNELAFAWATLQYQNDRLKKLPSLLSDKTFMSSREKMNTEIQRYSKSLGLNREQRAKFIQEAKDSALESLLGGFND